MVGVCESLLYAYKAGLTLETMVECIRGGAAGSWALDNLAPRIIKRDFAPGFFVEHFIKDMGIALAEADRMNIALPGPGARPPALHRVARAGRRAPRHAGADAGARTDVEYGTAGLTGSRVPGSRVQGSGSRSWRTARPRNQNLELWNLEPGTSSDPPVCRNRTCRTGRRWPACSAARTGARTSAPGSAGCRGSGPSRASGTSFAR